MTHIAPLVAVILTSPLLTWPAARASIFCTWTKVLPTEEVHYSFVRGDPRQAPSGLRLYHSSWSGERALLSCAWSDDAAVIQNYVSACRERAHGFSDHPDENFDVHSMLESEDQCVSVASPEVGGRGERAARRPVRSVRRGPFVPLTRWCGPGNKASSYNDLGFARRLDSCCREHDLCKYNIQPSRTKFGLRNNEKYTISHCDCDRTFRDCLKGNRHWSSDEVGKLFFNRLKMKCFELVCDDPFDDWCEGYDWALQAVLYPPIDWD